MCALCGVACGGADSRPPEDPSSIGSTSTMATSPSGAGTSTDPTPAQNASSITPASTTPNATRAGADNAASATPSTQTVAPSANAPAPRADAAVANNPGAADQTKNADNTKMNNRDRHDALTPMNQGNSSDEIKISAAIRKGIMGNKSLSSMAKNVKVITQGTIVTLRGPVHSDQEKTAIEALAKQTPGVTDVDDQLEVKK
jgi:hyperosmotically inducible protein